MRFLPSNLAALSKAASKENTKYATTNVHVVEKDGGYRCEATDTRVLAIVEGREHPNAADHKACIDALASQPNGGVEALINADKWVEILKPTKEQKRAAKRDPLFDTTGLVISDQPDKTVEHAAAVSASDGSGHARLQTVTCEVGRFPPCEDIWPRNPAKASVRLRVDCLRKLLDAASSFVDEEGTITLEIISAEKPVRVFAQPQGGQQLFRGLVMPFGVTIPKFTDPLTGKVVNGKVEKEATNNG